MGPRLWRAACYSEAGMRRGLHITITLMAVVLLLRPFDCLDGSSPKRQAMECCLKGKCAPTAKADECCKKTTPDYNLSLIHISEPTRQAEISYAVFCLKKKKKKK